MQTSPFMKKVYSRATTAFPWSTKCISIRHSNVLYFSLTFICCNKYKCIIIKDIFKISLNTLFSQFARFLLHLIKKLHNIFISYFNLVYTYSVHFTILIENNTWMCGNMKYISIVDQDISRVSKANE